MQNYSNEEWRCKVKESTLYKWAIENIEHFNNLAEDDKELFLKIYITHQAIHGIVSKEKWMATAVTRNTDCFIVTFRNNEWLHYYLDGSWG